MKEYNIDLHEGKHKVKITLQYGKYKGHIIYVIGGGGHGLGIIELLILNQTLSKNVKMTASSLTMKIATILLLN